MALIRQALGAGLDCNRVLNCGFICQSLIYTATDTCGKRAMNRLNPNLDKVEKSKST